jgi:hypothetical protein
MTEGETLGEVDGAELPVGTKLGSSDGSEVDGPNEGEMLGSSDGAELPVGTRVGSIDGSQLLGRSLAEGFCSLVVAEKGFSLGTVEGNILGSLWINSNKVGW